MAEQQLNAPACASPPVPASGIRHVYRRHPDRFTVVGNHLAQHPELSLTAIGLGTHIQSLPEGAKVSIKCLAGRFREGEVSIAAALRELEAHGYLTRTRERLPSGRIVTRTVSYNNPPAMRDTCPEQGAAPVERRMRRPSEPQSGESKSGEPQSGERERAASAAHASPACPPTVPASRPSAPASRPSAPASRPATPPSPLPAPDTPELDRHRTAVALLADLRRNDPRLLLAQRDIRRLAPAVAAWLEREVPPEAVRRTLTADLPDDPIRHPAAFLAHRLTALLPSPLPAAPAGPRRPDPLQNCDRCDHAFRAPEPGICPACESAAFSAFPVSLVPAGPR
ncbi:helix-turn-helix domain-containing protein [Streptomyces sp. KLOTTS4A1]|uniref:helix-turn-helix domain-containing protein n=1 Tax=Streptomyces sp. KLOTTS4A1 TaxID=3390996 RepID=UPI0039F5B7F3